MTASNSKAETARNATQGVARQANLLDSAGTPWYAVKHGNLELITRLFPSTCNVYAKGPVGENVFHVSMLLNTPSTLAIAKYLVNQCYGKTLVNTPYQERRHDKDAPGLFEGETALHIAIVNRNFDMVKFLIQAGADVRARCYGPFFKVGSPVYYGEFPLSFAASTGQKDIVSFLKRHGARVNSDCDTNGNTALHLSVVHSQLDMYDHLVDFCGASEYVRNNRAATPLLLAASLGKLEVFQHIYHKRRRVAWAYGPVTSYCLSLHEIDTVQNSGKAFVPNALETIIRKGHMHMLDDPIIMTLLRYKWKRFASLQFCVQALLVLVLVLVQTFLIWLHCKASMYNSSSRQALEVSALILAALLLLLEMFDTFNWAHLVYERRQLMKKDPRYCPPLYPIPGDTHQVPTKQKTGFLSRIVGGNKGPVSEGVEDGMGHQHSLEVPNQGRHSYSTGDHAAVDIHATNYWTYPDTSHGYTKVDTTRAVAEGSEHQAHQQVGPGPDTIPARPHTDPQTRAHPGPDSQHEGGSEPSSPFARGPTAGSAIGRDFSYDHIEPPVDIVSVGIAGATGGPPAMRRVPSFFVNSSAGGTASAPSFIGRTGSTHIGTDLDDLNPRPVMLNGLRSSFQHVHGIPGVNPSLGAGPAAASAISHYTSTGSFRAAIESSLQGQQASAGSSATGALPVLDRATSAHVGAVAGNSASTGGPGHTDASRPTANSGVMNTVNGVAMPGGVAGHGDAPSVDGVTFGDRPSKADSAVGSDGQEGITTRPSATEIRNRLRKGGGGDLPDGFSGGGGSSSLRRSESKSASVISHVNWSSTGAAPPHEKQEAPAGEGVDTREPLVTQGFTGVAQTLQHALSGYYRRQVHDPTTLLSACHLTLTLIHFITWAASYGGPDGSGPKNPKAREFDDIIVSCMAITGWLSVLYFTRGWEYLGSFQVMIELCMGHLFKFCCIFFLFNIGWALAFMSLLDGTTEIMEGQQAGSVVETVPVLDNIGMAMLELIRFLYGEAEYRSYTTTGSRAKRAVATCWFILYVAVVLLLLTKLLAAMIIAAYGAYEEKARKIWLLRWASYVLRAEARLPLSSQQACRLGEPSYDPSIGSKVYNHVYEVVDHESGKGSGNAPGSDMRDQEIAALEGALDRLRRDQGSS